MRTDAKAAQKGQRTLGLRHGGDGEGERRALDLNSIQITSHTVNQNVGTSTRRIRSRMLTLAASVCVSVCVHILQTSIYLLLLYILVCD